MPAPLNRRKADTQPEATSPLDYAVARRDQSTLTMVRDAIEHKQTLLAYQPVMRSDAQGKVAFYERLIRVLDPSGRIIPAKEFMPAVEDTELGRELDVLALRAGLNALHNNPGLRLSINMSARSIGYRPWMQILDRALSHNETVGERLILEITESSAMTVPSWSSISWIGSSPKAYVSQSTISVPATPRSVT